MVDAYKLLAKDGESLLAWRLLDNPAKPEDKARHLKNSNTLKTIIEGTPSKLAKIGNTSLTNLERDIEAWEENKALKPGDREAAINDSDEQRNKQNEIIRKELLFQELKRLNVHQPRPLCNLELTVCNILNSKGLGADVVFLIGFDEGKFPVEKEIKDSEIYQMLVAITRAKKRLYLINTISSKVSTFANCLNSASVRVEDLERI